MNKDGILTNKLEVFPGIYTAPEFQKLKFYRKQIVGLHAQEHSRCSSHEAHSQLLTFWTPEASLFCVKIQLDNFLLE